MVTCCHKENLIIGFNDGGAARTDRTALTENCRDAGIDVWHVLTQCRQGIPHQWTPVVSLNGNQPHFVFGKADDMQGTRLFNQTFDVTGDQLFRGDQVIDRDCVRLE